MKNKTIIFMDLEGTLVNEENGNINDQHLDDFIGLIAKLESSTNSSVAIHLVSPIKYNIMKQIKDYIDMSISRYNHQHKTQINFIESGACNMDEDSILYQNDNRIVPLPTRISADKKMIGLTEKSEYVKFWHQLLEEKYNIKNLIYIGNGRNDFQAMKYVQSKGGTVICPKNSRTKVREIADYSSNFNALEGVNKALSKAIESDLKPCNQIRE